MPVRLLVGTRQLSLIFFILVLHILGWEAHFSLSFAQESILDQGPMPDTVKGAARPAGRPFCATCPVPVVDDKAEG